MTPPPVGSHRGGRDGPRAVERAAGVESAVAAPAVSSASTAPAEPVVHEPRRPPMSAQPANAMYAAYFGLQQPPFSIAPDPRYLYMSERHREALAHLLYGVGGGGGFVLLSGEIGAGKTTVCRCFLEQIPRRCNVAYIFNPKLTAVELLQSVCDEFRLPPRPPGPNAPTVKDYLDPLNEFLLRTHAVGQNNVLIIDEAQNLSADVLEQLRLLTNLETSERKLLQIILIGQPELRGLLGRPDLEQLAQRVIARYHLDALSEAETAHYIRHRMAVAGLAGALPFDRQALRRIHRLARGVPRRINLLCDRALLGAYADNKTQIGTRIVDKAAAEVFSAPRRRGTPGRSAHGRDRRLLAWAGAAAAVGALVVGSWIAGSRSGTAVAGPTRKVTSAVAAASAVASSARAATAVAPPASGIDALIAAPIGDERAAWRQLALAWHATLADGDPCQAAALQQLHCYRKVAPLSLIRALGRPGILVLQTPRGRPVYALLTGLSSRGVTLQAGRATYAVSLAELAGVWRGDFATYWRGPPGGGAPAPDRLDAQLAAVQGPAAASVPVGDEAVMRSRVRAFQLTAGLEPDGIAGPTTYMQLNRATGVDEPRLQMQG